jgi:hypothetical protein
MLGRSIPRTFTHKGGKMQGTYINVQKQELPLTGQESMNDFVNKLREAIGKHIAGMTEMRKAEHVWPCEIYSDKVIVDVYFKREKSALLSAGPEGARFFQFSYKREGENFKFGDVVEVERKVVFTPKAKMEKGRKGLWNGIL